MTSDRHLALMALMREIEEPTKAFQRSVRLAASLGSDTPQWDSAVAKGKAALDVVEEAVRRWVADHPEQATAEVPADEVCGKCKQPFDPDDTAFDGRARYHLTPYCRGCVDRCHDNEIADHRCVICA